MSLARSDVANLRSGDVVDGVTEIGREIFDIALVHNFGGKVVARDPVIVFGIAECDSVVELGLRQQHRHAFPIAALPAAALAALRGRKWFGTSRANEHCGVRAAARYRTAHLAVRAGAELVPLVRAAQSMPPGDGT